MKDGKAFVGTLTLFLVSGLAQADAKTADNATSYLQNVTHIRTQIGPEYVAANAGYLLQVADNHVHENADGIFNHHQHDNEDHATVDAAPIGYVAHSEFIV